MIGKQSFCGLNAAQLLALKKALLLRNLIFGFIVGKFIFLEVTLRVVRLCLYLKRKYKKKKSQEV